MKKEPADDWWEERIEEAIYGEDHEVDSWMLELFVALIRDGYVPTGPDNALPLRLRGSALPEWYAPLVLSPRCGGAQRRTNSGSILNLLKSTSKTC